MINKILNVAYAENVQNKEDTGVVMNTAMDSLVIHGTLANYRADKALKDALENIIVYMTLKSTDHEALQLVDGLSLYDIARISDFIGGSAVDAETKAGRVTYGLRMKINVMEDDELVIRVVTKDTMADVNLDFIAYDLENGPEEIFTNVKQPSIGSEITRKDVTQVFGMTTPTGEQYSIKDDENSEIITDYACHALANYIGNVETGIADLTMIYNDRHGIGQQVAVKVPSGVNLVFVSKVYTDKRESRKELVLVSTNQILQKVGAVDSVKLSQIVGGMQ